MKQQQHISESVEKESQIKLLEKKDLHRATGHYDGVPDSALTSDVFGQHNCPS